MAAYVNPGPLGQYSDEARRCSDIVNLHLLADREDNVGRWVAIRLSDGGSDGKIYDSRAEAVKWQLHESQCAYVCIGPDGMTPRQAEIFLKFNRQAYENGLRMIDPDREVAMPENMEEVGRIIRGR
jgi:hypothetical protein